MPGPRRAREPERAVRKRDDDVVQCDGAGIDHPADTPRGGQCDRFFVRAVPNNAGGDVRLELVSVWERRRSHRSVQTISERLDGPGKKTKSDWRVCGRWIVLSLSAPEGSGPGSAPAASIGGGGAA